MTDPSWSYVALTHPGRVYEENQDAILIEGVVRQGHWQATGALAPDALVAIADGVTVSAAPARAAREVLEGFAGSYAKDPRARPQAHAERIHTRLCHKSNRPYLNMAATLVAAILRDQAITVLHCGDSRAYLIDGARIHPLTRDHTVLQRMLDEGEITSEQAGNAADLYYALDRCFVADPLDDPPRLTVAEVAVPLGTRVLLCSDGVTADLSDADLARLLAPDRPLVQVADALFEEVLRSKGDDNVSFIVVERMGVDASPTVDATA